MVGCYITTRIPTAMQRHLGYNPTGQPNHAEPEASEPRVPFESPGVAKNLIVSGIAYQNNIEHPNIWQAVHNMPDTYDIINVNRTHTDIKWIMGSIYEINPYHLLPTSAFTKGLLRSHSAASKLQDVCSFPFIVVYNANPTDF